MPLADTATATVGSPFFRALELDDVPTLLEASYRLRYQVYCHERGFLPSQYYPDGIETDVFDQHAVHLGVLNAADSLVATARLVPRTLDGLPMFGHCSVLVGDPVLADPHAPIVEVSRLAVSRQYNRRKGDEHYALEGGGTTAAGERRREGGEIVMTLYRALYQASKRHGFTHWLAATERSLQRLVTRYRFPFRQVGPEVDYFGLVAPYLMDLSEFDAEILSGQVPALRDFLVGLEPRFQPRHVHAN
jgi:N-acyl amino acid synthase of PEP-CTERM/exosortase system